MASRRRQRPRPRYRNAGTQKLVEVRREFGIDRVLNGSDFPASRQGLPDWITRIPGLIELELPRERHVSAADQTCLVMQGRNREFRHEVNTDTPARE